MNPSSGLNDDFCGDFRTLNELLGDLPDTLSEDTNDGGFSTTSISSYAGPGGRGTQTNTCDSDSDTRMEIPTDVPQRRKRKSNHLNISSSTVNNSSSRQTTKSASPAGSPCRSSARDGRHPHVIRIRNPVGLAYRPRRCHPFLNSDSGLDFDQYADDEDEEEEESPSPLFTPTAPHSVFDPIVAGEGQQTSLDPFLQIVEQPEKFYRARYACEGCRGPIKGQTPELAGSASFPTVKVMNYYGTAVMTVYLVTTSGDPHYHVLVPGSSHNSKAMTVTADGIPALQLTITPADDMTAIWDNLSIRRLRRWEGDRKLRNRGVDPSTWKKERVQAALMFQASIFTPEGVKLIKALSEPIQCTSPQGSPEISWISHDTGCVSGGNEIGLIGSKFNKGFKVRFYSEDWEIYANVDRTKSNVGGAVVTVPAYADMNITEAVKVCMEVRIGPDRSPICSDPVEYTYLPEVSVSERVALASSYSQSNQASPSSFSSSSQSCQFSPPGSNYPGILESLLPDSPPSKSPTRLCHSLSSSSVGSIPPSASLDPFVMGGQIPALQQLPESTLTVPLASVFGLTTQAQPVGNPNLMIPPHQPSLNATTVFQLKTELQSSNPECSKDDHPYLSYLPPLTTTAAMPSLVTQNLVLDINVADDEMLNMDGVVTPTEETNWLLHYLSQTSTPVCQPPQAMSVTDQPVLSLSALLASQPAGTAQENSGMSTLDVLTLLARRGLLKLD